MRKCTAKKAQQGAAGKQRQRRRESSEEGVQAGIGWCVEHAGSRQPDSCQGGLGLNRRLDFSRSPGFSQGVEV